MRFILFNIVVGVALVYLFIGGTLPLGDFGASIDQTMNNVAAWVKTKPRKLGTSSHTMNADMASGQDRMYKKLLGSGATASKQIPAIVVDDAPSTKKTVKVIKTQKPKPVPELNTKESNTQSADKRSTGASTIKSSNVEPSPQKGFTDLSSKAAPRLKLKVGTSMMSASERRRELDALAEDMEMLYIKKFGG